MKRNQTINDLFLHLDGSTVVSIRVNGVTVYTGEKNNMDKKYLKLHIDYWYVTSHTVLVVAKEKRV